MDSARRRSLDELNDSVLQLLEIAARVTDALARNDASAADLQRESKSYLALVQEVHQEMSGRVPSLATHRASGGASRYDQHLAGRVAEK